MSKVKYLSLSSVVLLFLTIMVLGSCSKSIDNLPNKPVEWNGNCTSEYKNDYLDLLNLDSNSANLKSSCDRFYQKYNDVKCMTDIESVEVRIHTADFDLKCNRGDFKDYSDPNKKKNKNSSDTDIISDDESMTTLPKCSSQLISFFQKTEASFEVNKSIITSAKNNDIVFNKALTSYRTCNQFFHIYKYSICQGAENIKYSFLNLRPYCQFFRNKLENLNKKFATKYYPEEFVPLISLKLRLRLNDPFLSFYPSLSSAKSIIVSGKSVTANSENKTENYCAFVSKTLKSSSKAYGTEAKVNEIDKLNDSTWRISFLLNNNAIEIYCRSARQIFLQDLKEILGNKTHIFID